MEGAVAESTAAAPAIAVAPPTIVGIEVTQGVQFFDLNGQGSGFAPDNSLTWSRGSPR
jgi:hypothetical protein